MILTKVKIYNKNVTDVLFVPITKIQFNKTIFNILYDIKKQFLKWKNHFVLK